MIQPRSKWKVSDKDVPDSRRFSNLVNDMESCARCGSPYVELHEVFNGPFRNKAKKYGLVIPLCRRCHTLVHINQKLDKELKAETQRAFVNQYGFTRYMEEFKKNYE